MLEWLKSLANLNSLRESLSKIPLIKIVFEITLHKWDTKKSDVKVSSMSNECANELESHRIIVVVVVLILGNLLCLWRKQSIEFWPIGIWVMFSGTRSCVLVCASGTVATYAIASA